MLVRQMRFVNGNCDRTYHPAAFGQGQGTHALIERQQFIATYCRTCPAKQPCLEYAYRCNAETKAPRENPIQWGIWGGKDFSRGSTNKGAEALKDWRKRIGQDQWERENGYEAG